MRPRQSFSASKRSSERNDFVQIHDTVIITHKRGLNATSLNGNKTKTSEPFLHKILASTAVKYFAIRSLARGLSSTNSASRSLAAAPGISPAFTRSIAAAYAASEAAAAAAAEEEETEGSEAEAAGSAASGFVPPRPSIFPTALAGATAAETAAQRSASSLERRADRASGEKSTSFWFLRTSPQPSSSSHAWTRPQ